MFHHPPPRPNDCYELPTIKSHLDSVAPFTLGQIVRPLRGNYQPLHILSYNIEYQLWGLNPAGYHAASLVLFLVTTSLVYYFTWLLGKKNVIIAVIATLLFSINAMRVESVAWASERKDMLYSLFYVAALISYVKYVARGHMNTGASPGPRFASKLLEIDRERLKCFNYTFFFFVLSVFSKVMAVTLVGAMVMLDYYYARRFSLRLVLEKVPFALLSIFIGIVQVKATASTHTFDTSDRFNHFDRILIASR
ncbi:MAG: hypothetical protein NT087_11780, partial [Deltaproteobacteria bacterium]|nr:hypothetical protein [Deltaproteobacteria bacterium]